VLSNQIAEEGDEMRDRNGFRKWLTISVLVIGIGLVVGFLALQFLGLWLGALALGEALTDVRLKNISLEEARQRAPFPICLATWLPEGLKGPQINFHSEWGAPWVADVTLAYWDHGQPVLEIRQAYRAYYWYKRTPYPTPNAQAREQAIQEVGLSLLEWQVGHEKALSIASLLEVHFKSVVHAGKQYDVYEIVKPSSYKAFDIYWWGQQEFPSPDGVSGAYRVRYSIRSRFSLSDSLRVAESLTDCLSPLPTPIPTTQGQ